MISPTTINGDLSYVKAAGHGKSRVGHCSGCDTAVRKLHHRIGLFYREGAYRAFRDRRVEGGAVIEQIAFGELFLGPFPILAGCVAIRGQSHEATTLSRL